MRLFLFFCLMVCLLPAWGQKRKIRRAPQPRYSPVEKTDTQYHYFRGSQQLSAKISSWDDYRRCNIWIYNRHGRCTYTFTEIRASFMVLGELQFHENGAVSQLNTRTVPDAGISHGYGQVLFDTDGDPLSETHTTEDYGRPSLVPNQRVYLYKKDGTKVLQESPFEQPVVQPGNR